MAIALPHIGQLRDRVRIERKQIVDDGMGNERGEWKPMILSYRAFIDPLLLGSGEQVLADRLEGVALFDVWLRYDDDTKNIIADDRVVDLANEARVFAISYAENFDQRGRFMLLKCTRGVAT